MQGSHEHWMRHALTRAKAAGDQGNVPVGALVIIDDKIVASGMNLRHVLQDPTAHAEMSALSRAGQKLGKWRLDEATLVVTLEPCAMCAGAIAQARVRTLVYGATEAKTGAIASTAQMLEGTTTHVVAGVLEEECIAVMKSFFSGLRHRKRS